MKGEKTMKTPVTLHTKQDFQRLMLDILYPLLPHYSKGKANLCLGSTGACYDQRAIELEAFARPLWALSSFVRGGGRHEAFERIMLDGIRSGTDPCSPEHWGGFSDYDQRFVEMASIAVSLLMIPEKLWEPLSDAEKENLADWLYGINTHKCQEGNWQFFPILVNSALKKLGRKYSEENLQYALKRVDDFYLKDGWYEDGLAHHKDYYIPFAFHFYGLIYAVHMADEDPERCRLYRERARCFAEDYIYWFSDTGAAIPYGRSLTYRFAQVSFFSACLYAGLLPFSLGVMKGIIVRHLQYWMSQPIFDNSGVLTIGYGYPNLIMSEHYNAPGSPYWCMKAFLFLALPDTHPFWSAEAEPLPKLADIKVQPCADTIIQRLGSNVISYPAGQHVAADLGHLDEKYSKFAYSTQFGFCVPKSDKILAEAAPDSMLVFEIGGHYFTRRNIISYEISELEIVSCWSPFPNITVKTGIIPTKEGHRRIHEIKTDIPCVVYDCGFAVSTDNGFQVVQTQSSISASNKTAFCRLSSDGGTPLMIYAAPNTNILYPNAAIPAVKHTLSGERTVHICSTVTVKDA